LLLLLLLFCFLVFINHNLNKINIFLECGVTYFQQNARIVGGVTAVPHSWPSLALIISSYRTEVYLRDTLVNIEISFMCSGTLLNRKSVLTACKFFQFALKFLQAKNVLKI
jgi:hypothetical protein